MAKRKKNLTWLYIVLGLVAIGLIAMTLMRQKNKPKGTKVSVEKAEKRTIKETVAASGKIYPEVEVNISSDVSGEIVELYIEEGDSVTVGQLLLKIDPDVYKSTVERVAANVDNSKAQLANSRAGIARAQAQVEQGKAAIRQLDAQITNQKGIHKRNTQLHKEGVISDADYEASQASLRSLEANLASSNANLRSFDASLESARQQAKAAEFSVKGAEASLKEARTSLKRTAIYAPMSGIVSKLNIEKGERVVGTAQMTGTEIMRIANMGTMEIQVDVSENDVLRVSLNDPVEIEVDAYLDKTFTGKVSEIANSAANVGSVSASSDQVTNFVVKVRFERDSYEDLIQSGKRFPFRPGMSGSVEISTKIVEDVLSVPIQAVTIREEKKKGKDAPKKAKSEEDIKEVVFIAEGDTVRMAEVKTGIQDDTYIQVLSGVDADAEVVTGPYSAVSKTLKAGKKINKSDKEELYKKEE